MRSGFVVKGRTPAPLVCPRVDTGWIVALTSFISTVVITVTAIAAFRQLRHYRNANDIVVYLRLIDRMDSPDVRVARAMLKAMDEQFRLHPEEFTVKWGDPVYINEMWPVVDLLRFLEHISVLVIKGEIAEGLILAEYAEVFIEIWGQCKSTIVARRDAIGPFTGRAFEHLAMRSKHYLESGQMKREYDLLERDPA